MEPAGRLGNVAAALLLGGASRRMGRDKAHMTLAGVAFATRLAKLLDSISEELWLVGGEPPPEAPGRRVPDPAGPRCALRGLVAALETSAAERVLVVATDLPLLTADLLLGLVAWPEADAVVPKDAEAAQPLCALYRRAAVLPVAAQRLAAGELALQGVLDAVQTSYVAGDALRALDPDTRALSNLNTPEDVARAEQWLARSRPTA